MISKKTNKYDVVKEGSDIGWVYTKTVKDNFFHPKNLLLKDPKPDEFNAEGEIGSPACGDVMKMWLKIDPKTERIKKLKWRTFGCASAIAATSMFSQMVVEKGGMKVEDALRVRPQDILVRLGGLPARKVHCSVLADKAFRKAIDNYFSKTKQFDRMISGGAKVIDAKLNITDRDIEEAVKQGVKTIVELQEKLKVGVGDPRALPEIKQLLRFYVEKYRKI